MLARLYLNSIIIFTTLSNFNLKNMSCVLYNVNWCSPTEGSGITSNMLADNLSHEGKRSLYNAMLSTSAFIFLIVCTKGSFSLERTLTAILTIKNIAFK